MRNLHTSRLASRRARSQVAALQQATTAANAVDRAIGAAWRETLRVLRDPGPFSQRRTLAVLLAMQASIAEVLTRHFLGIYRASYRDAANAAVWTLPRQMLRAASPLPAEAANLVRPIREDTSRGLVAIGPGTVEAMSAADEREAYRGLLFPGPDETEVRRRLEKLVNPPAWRMVGGTHRVMPEQLAAMLASGSAQGKTYAETAETLRPFYAGQQARARTVARTFGQLVAHEARMDADEQLGDMAVGWQIHATRDSRTRPEHAARDGTIYYKRPRAGQKGLDEMPRPPLEADGTPAWNCRCWLSVVLEPLDSLTADPVKQATFRANEGRLVPDPLDYSAWFDTAATAKQREAVGPRRWRAAADRLPEGQRPSYADFLDTDGGLLSPDALQTESDADREQRRKDVLDLFRRRQEQIRQVSLFGFEIPYAGGLIQAILGA